MAPVTKRDKLEPTATCRKQKERSRSRQNREQFRSLIGELSIHVTGSKLSTNKCLMAVSKTFKLSNVSDWPALDNPMSDNAMKFASIMNLLTVEGHLGWAFDSEGYILYVSPNFQKRLNIQGCVIGTHLSKLMPQYDLVLKDLFINNQRSTCTTIKKKSSKLAFRPSPTPAYMYGKVLTTHQGDKVYVGSVLFYTDKSSFHHQNFKHSNANFSEIILDENFDFLKRHKSLDKMQGFSPPLSNFLDTICPEDLSKVLSCFKHGTKKSFNLTFHIKKAQSDGHIMVYGQFYLGNTQNGNNVISAFLSPTVLEKLDESEILPLEQEIIVKVEKKDHCPMQPHTEEFESMFNEYSSPHGSVSTNESFDSSSLDDFEFLGSYGNLLPENDKDILTALDKMFPMEDSSDEELNFNDLPQLEFAGYIPCFGN